MPTVPTPSSHHRHAASVRAGQVLRDPKIWVLPTIVVAAVSLALSLLYMGGILNPQGDMKDLPVALVSSDVGATVGGEETNFGDQVVEEITSTRSEAIDWRVMTADEARDALSRDEVFGALEVPADFTSSLVGLGTASADPVRPTITVLTNQGAGSLGSSFASTATQTAAHQASAAIGEELTAQATGSGDDTAHATPANATTLLLADPVAVTVESGHPLGQHSGAGLSAFYFTLLLVLAGFIGANVVNVAVDGALGYADSEYGPFHTRRKAEPISRAQTFLVKSGISVALAFVTSALILFGTVTLLGMDAGHLPLLYAFAVAASAAVALGVHAINTMFGGLGQIVAMFFFIVLALPSSGATVPLEMLPSFYRFLAVFEPMRQLSDAVRSILYFDAQATGALARGWLMVACGAVLALVAGLLVARGYDRRGLRRLGHPARAAGEATEIIAREAAGAAA